MVTCKTTVIYNSSKVTFILFSNKCHLLTFRTNVCFIFSTECSAWYYILAKNCNLNYRTIHKSIKSFFLLYQNLKDTIKLSFKTYFISLFISTAALQEHSLYTLVLSFFSNCGSTSTIPFYYFFFSTTGVRDCGSTSYIPTPSTLFL